MSSLMFPARDPSRRPEGVWRGSVVRVSGSHYWVEVPRLRKGVPYGPCEAVETPTPIVVGSRVVVGLIEGRSDVLVILGKMA